MFNFLPVYEFKMMFFFLLFSGMILFGIGMIGIYKTAQSGNCYSGKPYHDSIYHNGFQTIPVKIQYEYCDLGGEGVAFHDTDSINSGSGALNLADGTYLNESYLWRHDMRLSKF